jgi:hypothetical protein
MGKGLGAALFLPGKLGSWVQAPVLKKQKNISSVQESSSVPPSSQLATSANFNHSPDFIHWLGLPILELYINEIT